MNTKVKEFFNEMFGEIRTVDIGDNKIWFVAKDIAEKLGYKDTKKAIRTHCKNGKKEKLNITSQNNPHSRARKTQEMIVIDESDLIHLIFVSDKRDYDFKLKFFNWLKDCNLISKDIYLTPKIRKEINFFAELQKRINLYNKAYIEAFKMSCINSPTIEWINSTNYIYDIKLEFQKEMCNGKYRVDCYIPECGVIIEYDEKYHETENQKQKDEERKEEILDYLIDSENYEFDDINFIRVKEGEEEYYLELILIYLSTEF